MVWLMLYLFIGIILGFIYYAWECCKYKKKYENKSWKLTWDEYSIEEEISIGCVITIFFWPICVFLVSLCTAFSTLGRYIRNYFGIE